MESRRSEKNRARYRTVAFRCSDSELAELNKRVELSGLQKQDYIIKSVLYQKITVVGNELMFDRLAGTLDGIKERLETITSASDVDEADLAPLRTAVELLTGFEEFDTRRLYKR